MAKLESSPSLDVCVSVCYRPVKYLDEAICAVAPVQALPGMVGSSGPSFFFSECVHYSFQKISAEGLLCAGH